MDKRRENVEIRDAIARDLEAASAIMDVAKVLAALQRTVTDCTHNELATGAGWAAGHQLEDRSLANLLAHGGDLLRSVERNVKTLEASRG